MTREAEVVPAQVVDEDDRRQLGRPGRPCSAGRSHMQSADAQLTIATRTKPTRHFHGDPGVTGPRSCRMPLSICKEWRRTWRNRPQNRPASRAAAAARRDHGRLARVPAHEIRVRAARRLGARDPHGARALAVTARGARRRLARDRAADGACRSTSGGSPWRASTSSRTRWTARWRSRSCRKAARSRTCAAARRAPKRKSSFTRGPRTTSARRGPRTSSGASSSS